MVMNYDLGMKWKEAVGSYFKAFSENLSVEDKKNTENVRQNCCSPDRESAISYVHPNNVNRSPSTDC
jgi:hypothetical protein